MATGPLRWVDIVEGMGTVVGAMGTVGVIASEENEVGSIETGQYRRGHSGYCGYACVWRRWSRGWSISWTVSPQQRTEILDSTPVSLSFCKYGWYGWKIQLVRGVSIRRAPESKKLHTVPCPGFVWVLETSSGALRRVSLSHWDGWSILCTVSPRERTEIALVVGPKKLKHKFRELKQTEQKYKQIVEWANHKQNQVKWMRNSKMTNSKKNLDSSAPHSVQETFWWNFCAVLVLEGIRDVCNCKNGGHQTLKNQTSQQQKYSNCKRHLAKSPLIKINLLWISLYHKYYIQSYIITTWLDDIL